MLHCVCLFEILPVLHRSGSAVKFPNMRSALCTTDPLDQPANFVLSTCLSISRWETNMYDSLGRSLEMCSVDVVVSQILRFRFTRPTNRHID